MTVQSRTTPNNPDIAPAPKAGASPSLDPARADHAFGELKELPGGTRLHSATREALASMHTAAHELDAAIKATPEVGPERGRLVDAARARYAEVARRVETSLGALAEVEQQMGESIARALTDPRAETHAGVAQAAEIRAALREMEGPARLKFVYDRIAAGDKQTAAAILNGPAWVANVTDENRQMFATMSAQRFAPEAYQIQQAAREAQAAVRSAGELFATRWNKAVGALGVAESDRGKAVNALAAGASRGGAA